MDSRDPLFTQAEVSDLSRRMGVVEAMVLGRAQVSPVAGLLVPLYVEACRGPQLDERAAGHWERQIYALDARALLVMARLTRDPAPWQPFLYLLDVYVSRDFPLDAVRSHLLSVAQDLLNLQGLHLIKPRDLMRNPLLVKVRLAAIRRRGQHAQGEAGKGSNP